MLFVVVLENGVKKIKPLTADAGAGNPVGSLLHTYKKSNPSGYLYCDGSTFDQTKYPLLYAYLGSNVLPDYRECVEVGAEQNTTDTIATHDVYTEGQFKDDQIQNIKINPRTNGYDVGVWNDGSVLEDNSPFTEGTPIAQYGVGGSSGVFKTLGFDASKNVRTGTTTHGKQKAVFVYIKATSGLSENAQDNVINTLNEQRSYSTEEVNTGKKWIDGKPIYRKVLNINGYPATIQTGLTSANEVIGMVCKNTVGGSDNNFTFGGILTDNNVYYPWAYQLSSDNTTLSRITSTYSGTVKFIILEYTKTN